MASSFYREELLVFISKERVPQLVTKNRLEKRLEVFTKKTIFSFLALESHQFQRLLSSTRPSN